MNKILLVMLCVSQFALKAQLNCSTKIFGNKTVSVCLHSNKKIATEETWNEDRFGTFKAYNNQGQEIYSKHLRKIGGHARVEVSYYKNGQVQKIYFSDAPDGGIQFYNSTTWFDESGHQTSFSKQGHDDRTTLMQPNEWNTKSPTLEKKQETISPITTTTPLNETSTCAIRKSVYSILNTTSQQITTSIRVANGNNYLKPINKTITIGAYQKIYIDSITLTDLSFIHNDAYKVQIINNPLLRILKRTLEAVNGQATEYVYVINARRKRS